MDFSNALMHCSTIAYFMTPGREKTPKQQWEEACNTLNEQKTKLDALDDRKKGMANGLKLIEKVERLSIKVADLEKTKDDEPLSQTAKSYLKKYYAYLRYNKWSANLEKGNKYTNKGKLGEKDSIQLLSFLDDRFLCKNTERIANDFLTGEPDVIFSGVELYLYDAKTSWDIETFSENLGKDLNPLYWWQMQGYMALTGAKLGEVSYCLVNTPSVILEQEKYNLARRMDCVTTENPEYKEAEGELINNMTFDDIPPAERRLKFIVERDDEAIARIYNKIPQCREYLAEIQDLHMKGVFNAIFKKDEGELAQEM